MPTLLLLLACQADPKPADDSVGDDTGGVDSVLPDSGTDPDTGPEPTACRDPDLFTLDGARWRELLGHAIEPALGDVDGDGALDLVVAVGDGVSVLRGAGDGRFGDTLTEASAGAELVALGAGDADGDGDTDVLGVRSDGLAVVFAGDGAGLADATIGGALCDSPEGATVADLDADGLDDLVVACHDPSVVVATSDGSLGFTASTLSLFHDVERVRAGDLDGDGDLDLVAGGRDDGLTAWEQGTGWEEHTLELLRPSAVLEIADVDGDGDGDVLAGHVEDPNLVWMDHDGAWTFERRIASGGEDYTAGLAALVRMDLDGDGYDDLAGGSGSFGLFWSGSADGPVYGGWDIWAVDIAHATAGDLDGDGVDELLVAGGGELSAGTPQGLATLAEAWWAASGTGLDAADIDGDGDDDLALLDEQQDGQLIRMDGGLPQEGGRVWGEAVSGAARLLDADGDGDRDVVVGSEDGLEIGLVDGGTIDDVRSVGLDGTRPLTLVRADLDADGDEDVLVHQTRSGDDALIAVFATGGELVAAAPVDLPSTGTLRAVGDLDGDGFGDAIVGGASSTGLELWAGDSAGGFTLVGSLALGEHMEGAVTVDPDGDGVDSVVISVLATGWLQHVSWDGSALVATAIGDETEGGVELLASGDLDGDGVEDLVAAEAGGQMRLYAGDGVGGFESYGALPTPFAWGARALTLGDVDADGDTDLALVSESEGMALYRNDCR